MSRARIIASCAPQDGGGVAAVCRSMAAAFREGGLAVEHVDSRQLVEAQNLARKLPGRRQWQSLVETVLSSRAVASARPADLTVTNGPIGWGINSSGAVHYYHGTYARQAEVLRRHIRTRGYLKLKLFDSGVLERFAGHSKICLANSQQTAEEVHEYFGFDCKIISCEIDTEAFQPGQRDQGLLEALGVGRDGRRVGLFVGAGRPMKGEATAFTVIAQVPEVDWLVLGEKGYVPQALRPHVSQQTAVSHDVMPALLRSADLVLAPSLYEPFGILVAETLASGTPVVASAQGVTELVGDVPGVDNYILQDPTDTAAAVGRVRAVLEGGGEVGRAALAARERIHEVLAPARWRRRFLEAVGVG